MHVQSPKNQAEDKHFTSISDSTALNKLVVIPQLFPRLNQRRSPMSLLSKWSTFRQTAHFCASLFSQVLLHTCLYHSLTFSWPTSFPFPSKSHTPVDQPSHRPSVQGATSLYLFGNLDIPPLTSCQPQHPPHTPAP